MIIYPNKFTEDRYVSGMTSLYAELFPNINYAIIETIMTDIVGTVGKCVDAEKSSLTKIKIGFVDQVLSMPEKRLRRDERQKLVAMNGDFPALLSYKNGSQFPIKNILEEGYPEEQEEQEELSKFVKDAIVKCAKDICKSTLFAIQRQENKKDWTDKITSKSAGNLIGSKLNTKVDNWADQFNEGKINKRKLDESKVAEVPVETEDGQSVKSDSSKMPPPPPRTR